MRLKVKLKVYNNGKFSTYGSTSLQNLLEKWIINNDFLKKEKNTFLLGKKSRKRNNLYGFVLNESNCTVVMKVSEISKEYKFWRRIDLILTNLIKDYNFNSYNHSIHLYESNVPTIKPLAYWTYKPTLFKRKSYFLYEKVESELSVTELYEEIMSSNLGQKDRLMDIVSDKCISIVQSIHMANIRHDDPHGGNILTDIMKENIESLTTEGLAKSKFTLIDNDRCTSALIKAEPIKRFFDIKCLTKFNINKIQQQELLQKYLGDEYNYFWLKVLKFWESGGFSLKNRVYAIVKNSG